MIPGLFKRAASSVVPGLRHVLGANVRRVAKAFGFDVVRAPTHRDPALVAFDLLNKLRGAIEGVVDERDRSFLFDCASHLGHSKAQNFQDVFALHALQRKSPGFFVEFGATDGVNLSNTYVLETKYRWKGVLAEPGKIWTDRLRANRRCSIDNRCVWTESGQKLKFLEAEIAELSTLDPFVGRDFHSTTRQSHRKYEVETISLTDLLREHDAPRCIDFLSIDTEGSELSILSSFDFDAFQVNVISVEHNYVDEDRRRIHDLLTSKGYRRAFEKFSMWDDWYVRNDLGSRSAEMQERQLESPASHG